MFLSKIINKTTALKIVHTIVTLLLIGLCSTALPAQNLEKILEFLTVHPNKQAVIMDSTIYPAKVIITPVVTYAPETNLSFGLGMKGLFKMRGSGPETRTSNIPLSVQYTIENKYSFYSGFEIFFPQERYMLTGEVNVQSFPSLYFDVGQDTPKQNEEQFGYSQILIEPIFLKNVFRKYLFLGGGIRYNRISRLEVEPEGLLATSDQPGAGGSNSTGLQLAMIYDSRDNILNASTGMFLSITHGYYSTSFFSTQDFQLTKLDFRYYWQPLGKASSILGFHFITHFSYGDPPLLEQARLGGGDIMRGYFEGRYVDRNMVATQVEWRQKLNYRWGVVGFAGIGSVASSLDAFNFETIRPSFGVGIRFLIDAPENLNIRFDYGVGNEKSNFYFKIAESF